MMKNTRALFQTAILVFTLSGLSNHLLIDQNLSFHEQSRFGNSALQAIAWQPKGHVLAVGGDLGIYLYDETLRQINFFPIPNISELAWSPNGESLAVSDSQSIRIVNATSGKTIHTFDNAISLSWDPTGTEVALDTTSERKIVIENATTGQIISKVLDSNFGASSFFWGQNGKAIVSTYDLTRKLVVSDAATGQTTFTMDLGGKFSAHSAPPIARLSPNGQYIALITDNMLRIFDSITYQNVATFNSPDSTNFYSLAWSPNSSYVAIGGATNNIRVFNIDNQTVETNLGGAFQITPNLSWGVQDTLASFDGDRNLYIWSVPTSSLTYHSTQFYNNLGAIAWSPDKDYIAGAEQEGTSFQKPRVLIWDTKTGDVIAVADNLPQGVSVRNDWSLKWSPDGEFLACTAGSQIVVWETKTYHIIFVAKMDNAQFTSIAWSPSSPNVFAAGGGDNIQFWDVKTNALLKTITTNEMLHSQGIADAITDIDWNLSGTRIVRIGNQGNVVVFDINSESVVLAKAGVCQSEGGEGTYSIRWLSDESTFVIGGVLISAENGKYNGQLAGLSCETGTSLNVTKNILAIFDQPIHFFSLDDTGKKAIAAAHFENNQAIQSGQPSISDWSTDGTAFATIADNGQIAIYSNQKWPTLAPTSMPKQIQLTVLCSTFPNIHRNWRVTNFNNTNVLFSWQVNDTNQKGTGVVSASKGDDHPGEVTFQTNTVAGTPNTVEIFVNGILQDTKSSDSAKCEDDQSISASATVAATQAIGQ